MLQGAKAKQGVNHMKKLLFSLAAAATCGVAAAAPGTATFEGATTFDPTKADDGGAISESNRGYW
jgi:hypothetical protein